MSEKEKVFYVGVPKNMKPDEQVRVIVVPEANGIPTHLDKMRTVRAPDEGAAALKYMEQLTGKKGAMRSPN
jgi:hypothetical protein